MTNIDRGVGGEVSPNLLKLQSALVQWFSEVTYQGVFATDTEFRLVIWNRWMEIHSGHAASDVSGRMLFDVYPDLVTRGLHEHYRGALDGRITVASHGLHGYILPLPPTIENLTFAEMPQTGRIGPLSDASGIIGTVTVVEDVSERLAAEAELRKQIDAQRLARATAEKALRAKDDFLSILSHEMRSPLNAVLGWARILLGRDEIERELLNRALQVIERNATAQAKLIDDMLDMARVVAGKLRLDMQPVDLLGIVVAAVDVVMPSAHAKRVTLRTSFDPGTARVLGDPDRLQQVIWNLLSNALKFTDPGGAIDVRLEVVPPVARIVVRDTGRGISPEFLPFVFERFRQSDASSARRQGGLGLGLALVRELVELHGGSVRAASEGEGKGATFTIELPIEMSPAVGQSRYDFDALLQAPDSLLAGVRVLVVDDEADARELTIIALERCGAEVLAAASGSDAITAVLASPAERRPHVLVSDIGMPREDGYELIRKVRTLDATDGGDIPAVALTGYATPGDVDRALAAGYQVHVAKPIDPYALADAVAKLVAGRAGGGTPA